jgi:hypothetical protein
MTSNKGKTLAIFGQSSDGFMTSEPKPMPCKNAAMTSSVNDLVSAIF